MRTRMYGGVEAGTGLLGQSPAIRLATPLIHLGPRTICFICKYDVQVNKSLNAKKVSVIFPIFVAVAIAG